jgi:SAM-dependent methyltransferase
MRAGVWIKRVIPSSEVRNAFRVGAYLPADALELITGKRNSLVPPRGMRFDSAESYASMGRVGLRALQQFCDLRPKSRTLDVGCGAGRMAVPYTEYLTSGSYEGFDIVPSWISWCQKNISARYSNVRFTWVDVYSKHYNSKGKVAARDFVFPYATSSFDCAMLMSIFTHMLPDGIENYIRQLARVLKTHGKAYVTTLLLNDESLDAIESRRSIFDFRHHLGDCRVVDKDFPETTIAVPEKDVVKWFAAAGLKPTIMYGSWAGRKNCNGVHDDIVVEMLRDGSR